MIIHTQSLTKKKNGKEKAPLSYIISSLKVAKTNSTKLSRLTTQFSENNTKYA